MILFRQPTASDVRHLSMHMRQSDQLECRLVANKTPAAAIDECLDQSLWAFAAEVDGAGVIMIFGLIPADLISDEGYPWMLCVEGVEAHVRYLVKLAPDFLGRMQSECERLSNVVHANNYAAIRFLKWCGFQFGDAFVWKGEPFLPFEWRRAEEIKEAA